MSRFETLKPILYYGFALIFIKAMAIFSIPLVTGSITPAEFGKLELIVSLVECAALISGLAISESFNRIASDLNKRRELAGAALIISAIFMIVFQCAATYFQSNLLHIALVTAGLTAMIELPLANLRAENRFRFFAALLISRSLMQIGLQYGFLKEGFGIEGVLLANMIVEVGVCLFLAINFARNFGFKFNLSTFQDMYKISFPYILGGLAMFAVGNADRWFIMRYVALEEIAFYGIAVKFSLFVALFSHAFNMWWGPRKYTIYFGDNGAERALKILMTGFCLNFCGGAIIVIASPIFVSLLLPASYSSVIDYIPLLIVVSLLNETATLVSLGAYRAKTGLPVLMINGSGAIAALTGYMILIPQFGIKGAIYATIIAHILRIVLYSLMCARVTPLPLLGQKIKDARA